MAKSCIAAQMYTLRDFTKTPADIAKTLAKVRKIGYESVQLSALGPIDSNELAKILKNEGLTCCATHVSLETVVENTQKVLDDLKTWDCKYTAIGGYFKKDPTKQDWLDFIKQFNEAGKRFQGTGATLGYHNHSHELAHIDGKPILQMLIDGMNQDIWFEIDTYWIMHGGGDPVAWINKLKNRIPCVHLKDMKIGSGRTQEIAEVGEGNMNWPAIIDACRAAGTEWYIIEQDICQRDPFDCLETSLKNVRQMGLH